MQRAPLRKEVATPWIPRGSRALETSRLLQSRSPFGRPTPAAVTSEEYALTTRLTLTRADEDEQPEHSCPANTLKLSMDGH
jgi:hypothetical protein